MDIPPTIATRLETLCLQVRQPAWVLVDNAGHPRQRGGALARYGLEGLDETQPIGHQIDYLEGVAPLGGEPLVLPLVQVHPETYVDLHLFPGDDGDWILWLDNTPLALRLFDIQQNTNELSLLRRKQTALIAQIRLRHGALLAVLDQLHLGSLMLNAEGRVEFLNASGAGLFGADPQKAMGRAWEDVLPLADADQARLRALLADPATARPRLNATATTANGRRYVLDIDVRDDPAEPGRRILYLYDVTEVCDLRRRLDIRAGLHEMIGASAPMRDVYETIRDVAAVEATVLIDGETGTGKELVAHAIHVASARRAGPFVTVNAAGLSDSLINSQLFGHKKGAFTDAVADQEGFFEAAHGGTIFLDEIGDIPMNTQTRILRALEQKEITRIGETRARQVDVRILAATNKDLNAEVARGQFRQDLLYRLRVARVSLPPLRARRDDIPLLVQTFLQQIAEAAGKPLREIDQEAMRRLMEYAWPGNVRELKNAIAFAGIHCRGAVVRLADLPPELLAAPARRGGGAGGDPSAGGEDRERILRALEAAGGSRGEAARLLGIGRATLYRRMKACLIDPTDLPHAARWNRAGD